MLLYRRGGDGMVPRGMVAREKGRVKIIGRGAQEGFGQNLDSVRGQKTMNYYRVRPHSQVLTQGGPGAIKQPHLQGSPQMQVIQSLGLADNSLDPLRMGSL